MVHLTGDLDAMAKAAFEARHGVVPTQPTLIVGQQTVADPSRAPAGCHTLWIETHVPSVPRRRGLVGRQAKDRFCDTVLDRLEAHAPGLGAAIAGLHVRTPDELGGENPNLVGGDLGAGSGSIDQQLVFRPVPGWFRYATPGAGPLPLLRLHPSRRRRPRHGRAQLRPRGCCRTGAGAGSEHGPVVTAPLRLMPP